MNTDRRAPNLEPAAVRNAALILGGLAKDEFAKLMKAALNGFLDAHKGELPIEISQLKAFFQMSRSACGNPPPAVECAHGRRSADGVDPVEAGSGHRRRSHWAIDSRPFGRDEMPDGLLAWAKEGGELPAPASPSFRASGTESTVYAMPLESTLNPLLRRIGGAARCSAPFPTVWSVRHSTARPALAG